MIKFEQRFLDSPYFIENREHLKGESYRFDTNRGGILSVIRNLGSYGYDQGKYEMAYIECEIVYEPLGYLTVDEVLTIVGYENGEDVNDIELIKSWKDSKGE